MEVKIQLIVALVLRLVFLVWGIWYDSMIKSKNLDIPKYTDVDYYVFSDAADYVYQNQSPYNRDTYRYTPLLAYLLQINIYFRQEWIGKLLFIIFDLICGYLICKINESLSNVTPTRIKVSLAFWLFNPLTIAVSTRGNAESLIAFLVLSFVYFLNVRAMVLAGLFFGLAVHFKIYPIIYSLAILLHIFTFKNWFSSLLKFGASSATILLSLTGLFYAKYGHEFLEHTYLYHLTRRDIRHNFSPYFYMLYLNDLLSQSMVIKLVEFLPQILLILASSIFMYRKSITFCFFLITFLFVTFNKVCTSQYYVWYLSLLPLVIPRLRMSLVNAAFYFVLWIVGQGVWLYYASELEFNGNNTFRELWLAGLFFAGINCYLAKNAFLDRFQFESKSKSE